MAIAGPCQHSYAEVQVGCKLRIGGGERAREDDVTPADYVGAPPALFAGADIQPLPDHCPALDTYIPSCRCGNPRLRESPAVPRAQSVPSAREVPSVRLAPRVLEVQLLPRG